MASSTKKVFAYIGAVTVLAAVYFVAAVAGLRFDAVSGFATLVWPPTGIALAAFLISGPRVWPAIFAGALIGVAGSATSVWSHLRRI